MSARLRREGGSEGLSDKKKVYLQIQHQAPLFTSNETKHSPPLVDTVHPGLSIDFYLRVCDKQCS